MADEPGVSVAFDADPLDPTPTWTRIDTLSGCRVRDWTIDRGRPTEFDKTGTGTAVIRIADRQGVFDPTNATSPYHGKVLPGKQANISLHNPVNDTWHNLFRGFVEGWHYQLDRTRQFLELELQLVDGFAMLARGQLRVGVDGALPLPEEVAEGNVGYGYTEGTLSDRIEAILGDFGWPAELAEPGVDVFSGNTRVAPKAYGPGTSYLDALFDAADAEFPGVANIWIDRFGHFNFHGRQARFRPLVAEYDITRWTLGDPSFWVGDTDIVPIAELEWSLGQDNLFNACSATPEKVGEPGTFRQLNAGPPDNDNVAGQYVTADDVGDTVSIPAYGLRSLAFDNLQTALGIATDNDPMVETKLFATYYVQNFASPVPRISRLVLKTRHPENSNSGKLWELLSNAEISDLLTIQTEHPGGGGFDDDFYVEGIHYTARPGPPEFAIVELSLDVSPRAHYTVNPFDEDPDP